MRIGVMGVGAIGSAILARLAQSGQAPTAIVRPEKVAALRAHGVRLSGKAEAGPIPVAVGSDAASAGVQDLLIVTLKAQDLPAAAGVIGDLLAPDGVALCAQNGVPWWYFHALPGPHAERRLPLLDPTGQLWERVGPQRVLGCVVHLGAQMLAPGHVHLAADGRMILGEPDGRHSPALVAAGEALALAGFTVEYEPRIRDAIWTKLIGNVSANPLSVLTGATLDRIMTEPGLCGVTRAMMEEAAMVGTALGAHMTMSIADRMALGAALGPFKTSMLQDWDAGRPLELDAVVGIVPELGRLAGIPTPTISMILALLQARLRTR